MKNKIYELKKVKKLNEDFEVEEKFYSSIYKTSFDLINDIYCSLEGKSLDVRANALHRVEKHYSEGGSEISLTSDGVDRMSENCVQIH